MATKEEIHKFWSQHLPQMSYSDKMEQGILIFTDEMTLAHKQDDGLKSEDNYCYWGTMRPPKRFVERLQQSPRVAMDDSFMYELITKFPIYFAIKGKVRGYFIIDKIEAGDYDDFQDKVSNFHLIFYSESWKKIKDGEVLKPSQGWRYYPKPPTTVAKAT